MSEKIGDARPKDGMSSLGAVSPPAIMLLLQSSRKLPVPSLE